MKVCRLRYSLLALLFLICTSLQPRPVALAAKPADGTAERPSVSPAGDGKSTQEALEGRWSDLGHGDAAVGHRAIWGFVETPRQSVSFLKKALAKLPIGEAEERIEKLVEQLDADDFTIRENASKELRRLGGAAYPALETALERNPTVEVRRRLERLLSRREPRPIVVPAGDQLRVMRAIQVLELIGTPAACDVLRTVAADKDSRPSRAAQKALDRIAFRSEQKP